MRYFILLFLLLSAPVYAAQGLGARQTTAPAAPLQPPPQAAPDLSRMSIEDAMMIMFMQMSQDARADMKAVMEEMEEASKKKSALREAQQRLNTQMAEARENAAREYARRELKQNKAQYAALEQKQNRLMERLKRRHAQDRKDLSLQEKKIELKKEKQEAAERRLQLKRERLERLRAAKAPCAPHDKPCLEAQKKKTTLGTFNAAPRASKLGTVGSQQQPSTSVGQMNALKSQSAKKQEEAREEEKKSLPPAYRAVVTPVKPVQTYTLNK